MITDKLSPYRLVTKEELDKLRARENETFMKRTPKSKALFDKAHENLLDGVPMPWMADWGTEHPIFLEKAKDARCYDVDGNEYIDFCLGDTGAMFGHSPDATAKTIAERAYMGITTMMPTEDSLEIGKDLSKRFGLPYWQVAMTATEANRYVIRNARTLTGRPKILVMQECYHGSLDETLPHIGEDGKLCLRSKYDSNPGLPKDQLTRVVEFNDVEALERELAYEDCAAVLLLSLIHISYGNMFYRSSDRAAPHNSYTTGKDVWNLIREKGWDEEQEVREFQFFRDGQSQEGKTAVNIDINYPVNENNYKYDEETGLYGRSVGGEVYTDKETGEQITTRNILVQKVKSKVLDEKGRLKINMTAGGDAMLFTNGTVAEGKWSREDLDSPTIFTDKEGKEFKLNVGTTWIQVVDDNTEISYK